MTDPFAPGEKREYFRFDNPGDTAIGIVDDYTQTEDRDPVSGEVKRFKNGDPQPLYPIELRDPTTGEVKMLYARWRQRKAIVAALNESGLPSLKGNLLRLKFTGLGQATGGLAAPKEWKAKIEPAPANAAPRKPVEASSDPFGGFDEDDSF